jgi:hypothetical protein
MHITVNSKKACSTFDGRVLTILITCHGMDVLNNKVRRLKGARREEGNDRIGD